MELVVQQRQRETSEYVRADWSGDVILDAQVVELAIAPSGTRPAVWLTGVWEGDPGTTRTVRTSGPVTLAAGRYRVYSRLTDSPEQPVLRAYELVVR